MINMESFFPVGQRVSVQPTNGVAGSMVLQ